ncbi:hypothetical protein, partial [Methylicorpusculum sp.]|uniref:hypothetical protein n=1 Tax=Methylicorpusculum sp. TaxID=2713644 RepID=UPI002AB8D5A8
FGSKTESKEQTASTSAQETQPAPAPTALEKQFKPAFAAFGTVFFGYLGYKYGAKIPHSILAPAVAKSLGSPRNKTLLSLTAGATGAVVGGTLGNLTGVGAAKAVECIETGAKKGTSYVKEHKAIIIPAAIGTAASIGAIVVMNRLTH